MIVTRTIQTSDLPYPIGKSWHEVMELLEKGGGGRTTIASHGQRARSQGPHSVPAPPGREASFRLQVRWKRFGAAQLTQRAPSAVNEAAHAPTCSGPTQSPRNRGQRRPSAYKCEGNGTAPHSGHSGGPAP